LTGFDPTARLAALDAQQLRRTRRVVQTKHGVTLQLNGEQLLSFCTNDYLGLAQHPALIQAAQAAAAQYGVGASSSAIVSGHEAPHELLESELAEFMGLPRALYFGSGYLANVGVIPALVGRGDAVFSDALNHACLIDGMRLSRADIHVYPHLDVHMLDQQLGTSNAANKLVVTDAVFSMDGHLAPLPELLVLCQRHHARLLIDDAHGFGVLGEHGQGSLAHFGLNAAAHPHLIYMATLGKAAGCAGAFVAADAPTVEWLMQSARTYLFATSTPAMVVQAVRASLKLIAAEPWRRQRLVALTARLRAGTQGLPLNHVNSPSAIQPILIGENQATLNAAASLRAQGLWVPAIRPPTVPAGTARLRVSLSAAHTLADVDRLVAALGLIACAPS
jgi:8-amino-7-oxononanoate synthase